MLSTKTRFTKEEQLQLFGLRLVHANLVAQQLEIEKAAALITNEDGDYTRVSEWLMEDGPITKLETYLKYEDERNANS